MSGEELKDKINTVLMQEAYAYEYNGRIRGGLGSFNVDLNGPMVATTRQIPKAISSTPNHNAIHSDNADVLIKLYSSLIVDNKKEFVNILTDTLDIKSPFSNIAYIVYYVLYKIGFIAEPLESLESKLPDYAEGFTNILGLLGRLLTHEYDRFRRSDLDVISNLVKNLPMSFGIGLKINEIKLKSLVAELDDVNPEINSDRDKVLTYWQKNFESSTIPTLIEEVESFFQEGQLDKAKLAICLGRVRVLLMDSMKELSKKFATIKNSKPVGAKTKDPEIKSWYKTNGILGDEELNLVNAVYGITSEKGSHAALSNREYARIAKNYTYEFIVMLVGLAGGES